MADKEKVRYITPPGTLIVSHIWEKDAFKDERGRESTPAYKVIVAFEPDDLKDLWDLIYDLAVDEWGDPAADDIDNDKIMVPIKSGDEIADEREKKGKKGDSTRGKDVLSASTIFNLDGDDAPGGIWVVDAEASQIEWDRRREVYPGCKVAVSLTLETGKVDRNRYVKAYLDGLQLVEQGERIGGGDKSSMFKPMIGEGSEGKGRRSRGSR